MGIRDAWRGLNLIGQMQAQQRPTQGSESKDSSILPLFLQSLPSAMWRLKGKPEKYYTEGYQQNIIVYRCISLIAEAAASAPPIMYRGDQQVEQHPALDLLQNPNPREPGEQFRISVFSYDLLAGESFQEGIGPVSGAPRELYSWRPDLMKLKMDTSGRLIEYQYAISSNQSRPISPAKAMHTKRFNPLDPLRGQSPLMAAARSADSHNEATTWNYRVLQNGAKPSGVLQQKAGEQPLSDDEYNRQRAEIDELFSGSRNAGRPLLLEGGLEWVQMMLTQSDLDWMNGKQMSAGEIALAYDVPEQLVGVPGQQTYNNYREARLALYEDAVIPLLDRYYGAWTQWFRKAFNDDRITLTYDTDQIPALSLRRERVWEKVQNADFLTINEQREAVGYEPTDGGDVIFVGASSLPLSFASTDPLNGTPSAPSGGDPVGDGAIPTGGQDRNVQDLALNGAQIQSVQQIVQAVADGMLPSDSAISLLRVAFPTIDDATARSIIDPATSFTPKTPPEQQRAHIIVQLERKRDRENSALQQARLAYGEDQ